MTETLAIPQCPDHQDPGKLCRFADVCERRTQHVQQLLRHLGPLCWEWNRRRAQALYDPPPELAHG